LHARAGRYAGLRRHRRAPLPRRRVVGTRRLFRRRRLLRTFRLPHHELAVERMARHQRHRVQAVLVATGTPTPARARTRPRRGCDLRGTSRAADRTTPTPPRLTRDARLLRELEPDLHAPVVLRAVRRAVGAEAHVVARD